MTEDEMVGWHHRLDGHKFEQTPGIGDGQGSLQCCSPWGHRVRHSLSASELKKNYYIPGPRLSLPRFHLVICFS